MNDKIVLYLFIIIYIFLSTYSQILIIKSKYDKEKKILQSLALWLLPIIAALLLLAFYKESKTTHYRNRDYNTGNEPNEYI